MFFFEKKNQKTFNHQHVIRLPEMNKVFLLLFLQKKKTFLLTDPASATGTCHDRS